MTHNREPRFVAAFADMDDGSFAAHEVEEIDPIDNPDRQCALLNETSAILANRSIKD